PAPRRREDEPAARPPARQQMQDEAASPAPRLSSFKCSTISRRCLQIFEGHRSVRLRHPESKELPRSRGEKTDEPDLIYLEATTPALPFGRLSNSACSVASVDTSATPSTRAGRKWRWNAVTTSIVGPSYFPLIGMP